MHQWGILPPPATASIMCDVPKTQPLIRTPPVLTAYIEDVGRGRETTRLREVVCPA